MDSCNFTNKANSHTSKVENLQDQNYATLLAAMLWERNYFV